MWLSPTVRSLEFVYRGSGPMPIPPFAFAQSPPPFDLTSLACLTPPILALPAAIPSLPLPPKGMEVLSSLREPAAVPFHFPPASPLLILVGWGACDFVLCGWVGCRTAPVVVSPSCSQAAYLGKRGSRGPFASFVGIPVGGNLSFELPRDSTPIVF